MSIKRRIIYISLTIALLAFIIILVVCVHNSVEKSYLSQKYQAISFDSEEEMAEAISGSWGQYKDYKFLGNYINFNDHTCTQWSSTSSPEYKDVTLDYKNGKIFFENLYYYDVVLYEDIMYIRITPNAKSEESYFLYKKCNESIPD